jgi:post-segregation antitoxin (ccd killing protein)
MRKVLLTAVRAAVVAALISTAVSAEAQQNRRRRWVPEFDPATAGAIATLLVGGGILIRNRRRK